MKRYFLIIFLILIIPGLTFSYQVIEDEDDLLDMLNSREISYSKYLNLLNLFNEKIDLNQDNLFQLQEIPGVSFLDVINILRYQSNYGKIDSISKLKKILNNEEIYGRIKPFIKITKSKKRRLNGKIKLIRSRDLGKNDEGFEIINLNHKKDITLYLFLQDDGFIHKLKRFFLKMGNRIILGDQKAKFGEGVILWKNLRGSSINLNSKNRRFCLTLMKNKEEDDKLTAADLKILLLPKLDVGASYLYNSNNRDKIFGFRANLNLGNLSSFMEVANYKDKYSYIVGSKYTDSKFSYFNYFRYYDDGFQNNYTDRFKVSEESKEEYFFEFRFFLLKFWQIYGCYIQENDLTSLLDKNTIFIKLFGRFNPKLRFSLGKQIKEEEGKEERLKTENIRLRVYFKLLPSLNTSIYFRYTQKTNQIDHYLKLTNIYKIKKNIKIKGEIKFQDTNIKEQGQVINGIGIGIEQKILPNLKYLIKYEKKNYSEDYNKYPVEKIRLRLVFKW